MNKESQALEIGIVGATGYSGSVLVDLILRHPHANLRRCYSTSNAGANVVDSRGNTMPYPLRYTDTKQLDCAGLDVLFTATPNGYAASIAEQVLNQGCTLIDLSADFRLTETSWVEHYGSKLNLDTHPCSALLDQAVYGLAEHNAQELRDAKLIAVAGCYVTSVLTAVIPLLATCKATVPVPIIADCKSGVTGAGKNPETRLLSAEVNNNFSVYGVTGHRHQIEISEKLKLQTAQSVDLLFTPHLLPIDRGILSTIYIDRNISGLSAETALTALNTAYADAAFVQVNELNEVQSVKSVVNTNNCKLTVCEQSNNNHRDLMIVATLDNLMKGAAGHAVQCMNLAYGLEYTDGLNN